jgi:hypothetical protein
MMPSRSASPAIFYRLIEEARMPRRPDRSASGTLPTRATRYCDAVTSASAFGWWLFSPLDFSLLWDGTDIFWHYDELGDWIPLETVQFPHFSARFDEAAPIEAQGCAPPFLTAFTEPGIVQIWTGLIARSAPNWSLLIRAPANLPQPGGFSLYEGIVETDRWFGPLFFNLRLKRTNMPVQIRANMPIAQVQPLPREAYADSILDAPEYVPSMTAWNAKDWEDYMETVVRPSDDPDRQLGRYAVAARKRRKSECPYHASRRMAA